MILFALVAYLVLVLAVGLLVVYFLPSILAGSDRPDVWVVNLLLGWTVIGWFVALVMAASTPRTAPTE